MRFGHVEAALGVPHRLFRTLLPVPTRDAVRHICTALVTAMGPLFAEQVWHGNH